MGVTEQVLMAGNSAQALRTLVQTCGTPAVSACSCLILLNMNMPVLNGQAHRSASVIVLLITSLHLADLARAQELPIASFLNKPLTKEKVTALLEQHFAQ